MSECLSPKMKFVNNLETAQKVLLDHHPEFTNSPLRGDGSGWDNFAVFVDDEYIFRFPRREDSYQQIIKEHEVLENLQTALPQNIQVPQYLTDGLNSDSPFVYYKMIDGKPLTSKLYSTLDRKRQSELAKHIATFLRILHKINPKTCPDLKNTSGNEKYRDLYRQVREICFRYLSPDEQRQAEAIFENYFRKPSLQHFMPTVVHGDLSGNHILVADNGIGVIDFGDAEISDPAINLSWFYLLNPQLFYDVLTDYAKDHDVNGFEERIQQFYIPIIPYYGIIFGVETRNHQMVEEELADLRSGEYNTWIKNNK